MSISYQPKQTQVQAVQLKVQQLVLKSTDNEVLSGAGSTTITVTFGQAIEEIRACIHLDDSAPDVLLVPQSDIVFNGAKTVATITLSAALEADKDVLIIDYVAAE
jgi:DNA-binding protein YbaB